MRNCGYDACVGIWGGHGGTCRSVGQTLNRNSALRARGSGRPDSSPESGVSGVRTPCCHMGLLFRSVGPQAASRDPACCWGSNWDVNCGTRFIALPGSCCYCCCARGMLWRPQPKMMSNFFPAFLLMVILAEVFFVFFSDSGSSHNAPLRGGQGREREAIMADSAAIQDKLRVLNRTLSDLHQQLRAQHAAASKSAAAIAPTIPIAVPATTTAAAATAASPKPLPVQQAHGNPDSSLGTQHSIVVPQRRRRVLIYTMDSISSYEENSRRGGAAGEILIRLCLEKTLKNFGVDSHIVTSDYDFDSLSPRSVATYDYILLDPWTWAAKGWVPKASIRGQDAKIFILDFFGSPKLRGSGLNVPPARFLTAYGSPWNTFLGFYLPPLPTAGARREQRGVIWGKDANHFDGKEATLRHVADHGVKLIATATIVGPAGRLFVHDNVQWLGHQTAAGWQELLASSKFLLGMGDPLLGPSAIEAIAAGCMYINPIYPEPAKNGLLSQHPWAAEKAQQEYVCSYHQGDMNQLMRCVDRAMKAELVPHLPQDFTEASHRERVKSIFGL